MCISVLQAHGGVIAGTEHPDDPELLQDHIQKDTDDYYVSN